MNFVDTCQCVTNRLVRNIHQLRKILTVKDIAEHLDINPKSVKVILRKFFNIN